jgi:hypothetical protein
MSKGALSAISPLYAGTRHAPKAPQPYMPAWQNGADSTFQGLATSAAPWAQNLPGQVIPGAQNVVNNVANNPYWEGAQNGANDVADLAGGTVAPGMMAAAGMLGGQGVNALGQGQDMMSILRNSGDLAYNNGQVLSARATDMLPGAVFSGYRNADPFYKSGMAKANTAWNESQMAIPGLTQGMDYAQHMLDTGFDPQGQLYDREYQKMQDQQNAINSMYGVSSSPYGAGLAGDASRNFNIDWQNQQLQRQMAALQGFGGFQSGITGNLSTLLNTGGNQYNQLSQGAVGGFNDLLNGAVSRGTSLLDTASTTMNRGVDNQRLGYGTGADIYTGMNRNAQDLFGAASAHGTDALNTLYTSTQLPSQTYLGQQQSQMTAIMQMAQAAGISLDPSSQMMTNLLNYMKTGQGATALSQNAFAQNQAASAASTQGLTSALGTIAGIAMAPATGGTSLFMSQAGAPKKGP